MKTTLLKPLTIREITFNANRKRELEIIAALPVELVKKSKVHDEWFSLPIPNFLRDKN